MASMTGSSVLKFLNKKSHILIIFNLETWKKISLAFINPFLSTKYLLIVLKIQNLIYFKNIQINSHYQKTDENQQNYQQNPI
jgi:hypothetical protein